MLPAYKAILQDNYLHWIGGEPEAISDGAAVTVYVTIAEEPRLESRAQQQQLAAVLDRLAQRQAAAEISDPVAWQRELREDRPLPGRE